MAKSKTRNTQSKSRGRSSQQPRDRERPRGPGASGVPDDLAGEDGRRRRSSPAPLPFNANKAAEYDPAAARRRPAGATVKPDDPIVGASTVTEAQRLGQGRQRRPARSATNHDHRAARSRARRFDGTSALTTNQGVPVADNQNSLKAGLRGPTLLEDFILREKITHFDHERIPERIVHARGSAAHGYFECYEAADRSTRGRRSSPRPASRRRSSSASRPCSASAARPTPRATCAASR